MKITRVLGISLAVWLVVSLAPAQAQGNPVDLSRYYEVMLRMAGEVVTLWRGGTPDPAIFETVGSSGDPLYIPPLIDVAFFLRGTDSPLESAAFAALGTLTGQSFGTDWQAWFTWDSAQNPALPPSYATFKGMMMSLLIDPDFTRFLNARTEETARVNVAEVVWGGVRVDGITPLTDARQITPADAAAEGESLPDTCRDGDCRYPAPDEYVFGITLNGDSRAYPLRLLNWHEVMNDTFGLTPLYDQPGGNIVCQFRAPTEFHAVARQGDAWVMVGGESAGCPPEGWFTTPETLKWSDERDWPTVSADLPDLAADPAATPLSPDEGVIGSVSGQSVALAYCTLCGSGILYDSTIPDVVLDGDHLGPMTLEFSSTGLLMRSNKLMYDRDTDTVWNAMTGEPAFGALAPADLRLTMLPMVVTDWASWLAEHPDTSVLSLQTGYEIPYVNGGAYHDYFNDPNILMFPVWQQDTHANANKEMVFTLNLNAAPKAYPLRLLIPEKVVNDTLGGVDVVIVARGTPERDFFEPGGAEVRAYQRGGHTFQPGETASAVIDEAGRTWTATETALVSPDGEQLARLAGHLSFWFGWYGFYPNTLVYTAGG